MIDTLGYVTLTHVMNGHVVTSRFYVMLIGTIKEHMVLARTWCYQGNCQIDWRQRMASLISIDRASVMTELLKDEEFVSQGVHELKKDVPKCHKKELPQKQISTMEYAQKVWICRNLL